MNREEYKKAFSKIEPSMDLVEAALSRKQKHRTNRLTYMGKTLLVAILAISLLTAFAFAAVHFRWFHISTADDFCLPTHDTEADCKDEYLLPKPYSLLTLEEMQPNHYIGFTLPESYLDDRDTVNCRMLRDGLYGRYYQNSDPSHPDSPLLTIEVVYDGNYLTYTPSEIVKEETLNGMQTIWFILWNTNGESNTYSLFQHNKKLKCYVVISSTLGFKEAEEAAKDLFFKDSGIPIKQKEDFIFYGFRMNWIPEDMVLDTKTLMADCLPVTNATLQDNSLDLSEIYLGCRFYRENETSHCGVGVGIEEGLADMTPIKYGTVYKTGSIGGHDARWVHGSDRNTYIVVTLHEQQIQVYAHVSCAGLNPATGDWNESPAEESFIKIAEMLLESAEIIPVAVSEPAPKNFSPFSVG